MNCVLSGYAQLPERKNGFRWEGLEAHELRPRRIGHVGDVASSRQVPDEPRVDRAADRLAANGRLAQALDVIEP